MAMKIDLNAMLLFYEVANAGSLTKAAQKLDLPKSTLSRKIAHLEDQMGVHLLKRGNRKITVTDAGRALAHHCERISSEIEDAGLFAHSLQTELRGKLHVSMPIDFGISWLSRAIGAFAMKYPDIHLDIEVSGRWVDVNEDRCDVAIHLGRIKNSQVPVRRLARVTRGVYASPDYVRRRGEPTTIEEFAGHNCIVTDHQRSEGVWTFQSRNGDRAVAVEGHVTVNNIGVARELIIKGVGIGILPNIMCRNDVKAGRLVPLLADWESPALEVSATFLGRRRTPRMVRVFLDFIAESLGEEA
ncbi:LysR family transcriptional regulator [Xanthobacter pseudotagetidis]|uniref:LysR family transcriptional regulator n=1 Tax=Xanthobacter pseudotagetidis TaxID=3119911 RepID=UPI0037288413